MGNKPQMCIQVFPIKLYKYRTEGTANVNILSKWYVKTFRKDTIYLFSPLKVYHTVEAMKLMQS